MCFFICLLKGKKLITFHGDLPYSSTELIEKLESLDEEDIVGSGGFGTVYRMVMNDLGTFAVKKIDRSREGSDRVFEREVEILGSVKHINLVNLRGYCRLPSSRLLIYDYLTVGSLDNLLHGKCTYTCLIFHFCRLCVLIFFRFLYLSRTISRRWFVELERSVENSARFCKRSCVSTP